MPFQTPEEIEKKNKIIYEFIEKIYPFNKNNYDTQTVSKYAKKCMLDILQIEDKAKKRYINPLVKTENGFERISDISDKARECIDKCLSYTFDRYVYMDFDFDDRNKVLRKRKND